MVTEIRLDSWLAVGAGRWPPALYLYGVHRLRLRGDRWPVARTVFFLGPGLGSIAAVTVSGLHAYDTALLSRAHGAAHGAVHGRADLPGARRAGDPGPAYAAGGAPPARCCAVLHSRVARVLTFPLVAFGIFVANPFVLYFTGLYRLTLEQRLAARAGPRPLHRHRLPVLLAAARARPAARPLALPGPGAADGALRAVPHRARADHHAEHARCSAATGTRRCG